MTPKQTANPHMPLKDATDPIQAGDLVRVVKAGCEHGEHLIGRVFIVPAIEPGMLHCRICLIECGTGHRVMDPIFDGACFDVSWLKKIPPLAELDDVKRDEEITA